MERGEMALSPLHSVRTGTKAHSASLPMRTGDFFLGIKVGWARR
jgi:hypothetical protein